MHPSAYSKLTALRRITVDPSWLVVHLVLLVAIGGLDAVLIARSALVEGAWRGVVRAGAWLNAIAYSAFVGADGIAGSVPQDGGPPC